MQRKGTRELGLRGLVAFLLGTVLFGMPSCQVREPEQVIIDVVFDHEGDTGEWIDSARLDFHERGIRTVSGKKISIFPIYMKNFQQQLELMGGHFKPQLIFLNANYEKALLPVLAGGPAPIQSLGMTHLVVASVDQQASQRTKISLKHLLTDVRKRRIRFLQQDPAQSTVGLAALLLEGHVAGVVSRDSNNVDPAALDELMKWLPSSIVPVERRKLETSAEEGDMALITEATCAAVRQKGVSLSAAYPKEGTLRLDYPAFITQWASREQKEAAMLFLDFLNSPEMQKKKESTGLGVRCVSEPGLPEVLDPPSPSVMQHLRDSWLAHREF